MMDLGLGTTVGLNKASPDSFDYFLFQKVCDSLVEGFKAMHNLHVIGESIEKYGVTDQLKDLVYSSFESMGVSLSTEGVFKAIGDLIRWILEQLGKLWGSFTGLFKANNVTAKSITATIRTVSQLVDDYNLGNNTFTVSIPAIENVEFVFKEATALQSTIYNFAISPGGFTHPDKIPKTVENLRDFVTDMNNRLPTSELTITVNQAMIYIKKIHELFNFKFCSDKEVNTILKGLEDWIKDKDPNDPRMKETCKLYEWAITGIKLYGEMVSRLKTTCTKIIDSMEDPIIAMGEAAHKKAKEG